MKCPYCKVWAEVLETRTKADGSRRRRYQCANLHRFTTIEMHTGLSSYDIKWMAALSSTKDRGPGPTNKPATSDKP